MFKGLATILATIGLTTSAVAAPATPPSAASRLSIVKAARAGTPVGQRVNRQDTSTGTYLLIGAAVIAVAVGAYFLIDDDDDNPTSA